MTNTKFIFTSEYLIWSSICTRSLILLVLVVLAPHGSETLNYNITVDPTGEVHGSTKTIKDAISKAPTGSTTPFVIHIMKGMYNEDNLFVSQNQLNIWFIGDGIGQTVIYGNKSVKLSKLRSPKDTATFSVLGSGVLLQDLSFENNAGPDGQQAVALYVEADRTIVYRCEIKGFQDTLWVARYRQFFRECYVSGTVDFIYGDASAMFQNCTILARRPNQGQKNAITAQGRRTLQGSLTGIVIHRCNIKAAPDLLEARYIVESYLGRPWKEFATVIVMESHIDDFIDPLGWLEWNSTAPREHLYFAEFENYGPGANITRRVKWPSVHPNISRLEAEKFTVDSFIQGETWITTTNVPFHRGLYN